MTQRSEAWTTLCGEGGRSGVGMVCCCCCCRCCLKDGKSRVSRVSRAKGAWIVFFDLENGWKWHTSAGHFGEHLLPSCSWLGLCRPRGPFLLDGDGPVYQAWDLVQDQHYQVSYTSYSYSYIIQKLYITRGYPVIFTGNMRIIGYHYPLIAPEGLKK